MLEVVDLIIFVKFFIKELENVIEEEVEIKVEVYEV